MLGAKSSVLLYQGYTTYSDVDFILSPAYAHVNTKLKSSVPVGRLTMATRAGKTTWYTARAI